MNNKKIIYITSASIFLIIAIFLRFWMLGMAAFSADNMDFYRHALNNQSIIEFWKNPPWLNQIPLNETLTLLLVKIGLPATPFVTRLPFAIMGVLSVFSIFLFAKRFAGSTPAMLVLVYASINPYQIYFSRTAYHYSGAIFGSTLLLWLYWEVIESMKIEKRIPRKKLFAWFIIAIFACHMHMSVWAASGALGILLGIFSFLILKNNPKERKVSLLSLGCGGFITLLFLSRWILRGIERLNVAKSGGKPLLGNEASAEVFRFVPAYFAGENIFSLIFLLFCLCSVCFALFAKKNIERHFIRHLALVCLIQIIASIAYVVLVSGGLAKISYFSACWPALLILLGCSVYYASNNALWRRFMPFVAGLAYCILVIYPSFAIVRLEGKPAAIYKINDWFNENIPEGTPILVDRWFHPWNELAIHNPGNINYTFTVPDEPLENYRRFNWRKTAEDLLQRYPSAPLLEVSRGKYERELGKWRFPEKHFARVAEIVNEPALVLRRYKVFPINAYAKQNTNGVITRIFYNTREDIIARARSENQTIIRLFGSGWGYAKPGWQQGHFEDYRILQNEAQVELINLANTPKTGIISIVAASSKTPKRITIENSNSAHTFAPNRLTQSQYKYTLNPGTNTVLLTSRTSEPLFVRDLSWLPQ